MAVMKNLIQVKTFVLIFAFSVISIPVKAEPPEVSAQVIVNKAFHNLFTAQSIHCRIDNTIALPQQGKIWHIHETEELDLLASPLLGKRSIHLSIDLLDKISTSDMEQYFEQNNDKTIVYTNAKNIWQKASQPYTNPLTAYANFLNALSGATLMEEDAGAAIYTVTADASAMQPAIDSLLRIVGMPANKSINDKLKMSKLCYIVTMDKKTMVISKISIDLSPLEATFGDILADSLTVPENNKQLLRNFFRNMKVTEDVTFSQFNSVKPLSIPPEAKAALATTPGQQQAD
jgi:hypothetical protein